MKLVFILFVFLSSLIPTWLTEDVTLDEEATLKLEEFENTAKNAYDDYYIYKVEKNENYLYEVILGKYKNDLYYDIFLYNVTTEYVARIEIDDAEYSIEKLDNNGHVYYSTNSITNPASSSIYVYLFDGISKYQEISIPNNYNNYDSVNGSGKGVVVSYPEPIETVSTKYVNTLCISICIIFISIIGIGIFYIVKMGKKTATPMGYQKNLPKVDFTSNESIYSQIRNNDIKISVSVDDEIKDTDIETKTENEQVNEVNTESVYDKSPKYSDEADEVVQEADIESLLLMKGYKTDYSIMSEEEKNEVMVYLMILRKQNQISYDQYSKEVIKLWRK